MTGPLPSYVDVGAGPETIVFLHGLGGDYSNWQPQLDEFSNDFRCLAWTLPGYGSSPAIDELTWSNLSDLLARVLDDAKVDRAHVVGLSMGGYIAQQFSADHPARVDRLVLAATSAHFGRGSAEFAEKFLAQRLKPLDEGATPATLAPKVVPTLLSHGATDATIANCVTSMSQISPDAYRAALHCLVTWNFTDRLHQIEAPTLCLAGAADRTAPEAALAALADGLAYGEVAVIDDCQHLMNLDRPEKFNQLVRDFLRK